MKDKNIQREKLAKVIFDKYSKRICSPCGSETACQEQGFDDCGICSSMATDIIEAGYGNIRQALTEFVKKLKANMFEVDTKEYGRISAVGEDAIDETLKEFLGE